MKMTDSRAMNLQHTKNENASGWCIIAGKSVWYTLWTEPQDNSCPLAQYKGDTMPKIIKDERTCDKEVKND